MKIEERRSKMENAAWLPDMDLNHDKQIQSLLCYRYTIGQTRAFKLVGPAMESSRLKLDKWINGLMDYGCQTRPPEALRINPLIQQSNNPSPR